MDEVETTYSDKVSDEAKARMRRERKARKWTFDELASRSGIKRSTLSSMETGSDKMNLRVATAVARAFEMTLDEFLGLGTVRAPAQAGRIVGEGGIVDLTGFEGQGPVRAAVDIPELEIKRGDHLTIDANVAPALDRILAVEDEAGVTRLYRVRSMDPMILERSRGPSTVYDPRYHRIRAVVVRLIRDL